MWKNIWPILVIGAIAYALYTEWNPLEGVGEPTGAGTIDAGGPAAIREAEQMPDALDSHGEAAHGSGGDASVGKAARRAARGGGDE